jgi:hypothetical protein
MIVRKLATRGRGQAGSEEQGPQRNRAWQFLWLVLGAGAVSGLIALVGPGLVTALGAQVTTQIHNNAVQPLDAHSLFPPVAAVHKVVDVYDPAPPRRAQPAPPAPPAPPAAAPPAAPVSHPSPTPSPHRSPRPTPHGSPSPDN